MKRFCSLFIVVCLLLSLIPAQSASAETAAVSADTGETTLEGTDSLGTLLTRQLQQKQADDAQSQAEYSDEYCVLDLTFQDQTATVEYSTAEMAVLVVAIYTEDGLQLITSGKTVADPEQNTATVTIDALPDYFGASAFLLDVYDSTPLCAAYYTPMYTREMQALVNSTAEDYDEALVLNLDQSAETNFAVYQEQVIVIPAQDGVNTVASVDNENKVYVIENADTYITGLAAGEIFAYSYAENKVLIAKVSSVAVDGTTATVTGDELELEEVFSHLKIEQTGDPATLEVDESEADEGITYVQTPVTYADEGELTTSLYTNYYVEKQLTGDDDANVTVEGAVALDLDVTVSFYISASRQFVKFRVDSAVTASITATGSVSFSAKMPKLTYNIYGIGVGFKPKLELTFSASLEFSMEASATVGFSVDADKGFKNLSKKPKVEADLRVEGTIFFGINLNPTIDILDGTIVELSLKTPIGFELKATPAGQLVQPAEFEAGTIHNCQLCIDMELYFKREIAVELVFLKCDDLTLGTTLSTKKYKICDLYFSLDQLEFGTGACPYESHLVSVTVTDSEGIYQNNVQVTITEDGGDVTNISTNTYGCCRLYLPTGEYTFSTQLGDVELYRYAKVDEACKINMHPGLPITLEGIYTDVAGMENVTDHGHIYAAGVCGDNTSWQLYASGLLVLSGNGATYDWNGSDTPWYDVRQSVKGIRVDDGITYVGNWAFYHCYQAKSLTLSDSVLSAGNYVFSSCSALQQVNLGASLRTIGINAFSQCAALEEIALPDSLQDIGSGMFSKCSNLTQVQIPYGVTAVPEGMFSQCAKLTSVTIPETVTEIGDEVFQSCTQLTAVMLPEKITSIGQSAFQLCSALEKLNIPEAVTDIGRYAFTGCSSLSELIIPDGIKTITNYMFSGCTNLQYVRIPDTVTVIGTKAFYNCNSLLQIQLPEGLYQIGSQAFDGCAGISQLYFPASLTTVEASAFQNCSSLNALYFIGDAPAIHSSYGLYGVTATAYYPADNTTWTADKLTSYGGTITWQAYDPTAITLTAAAYTYSAPATRSVFGGNVTTQVTEERTVKTASFTNLVPQGQYALLVVADLEAEDMLAADNLLYIAQGEADDNGELSFEYVQRREVYPSYVMACGPSDKNLTDAVITFPAMVSDGLLQTVCPTVSYDGKTLTEGQDYVIVGNVSFIESGVYSCTVRGIHNYAGLVKTTYTVLDRTMLDCWNLTLGDQICMNFYMSLSDSSLENTQVHITLAGETVSYTAEDFCMDTETEKYIFTVPLAAVQMTEEVTVAVYVDGENTETKTYCVAQYAAYILEHADSYDKVTVKLVADMLLYGGAAQAYFAYKTDVMADEGITDPTTDEVPETVADIVCSGDVSGISFYGASLVYRDRIAVRYYFKGDVTGCLFSTGEHTWTPTDKDGLHYIEIADILPQNLDQQISLTVTDADGNALTVTYGPMNYIVRMNQKNNDTVKNLMKALYNYHLAAKAFTA